MASGITHILLMKNLQSILPNGDLKKILQSGRDFLQVGAVGPDLPYASIADGDLFFSTQSELADKFHNENTNVLILRAFQDIKNNSAPLSDKEKRFMFSFFLGFTAHIIADGIINPFIRDKVGNYHENQTAHRVLEMQLDVLLFHHLTKNTNAPINLNYSNIHDELINFDRSFYREVDIVLDVFSKLIKEVYGIVCSPNEINGWVNGLHRMFSIAEGDHPKIYRVVGFINNFLFSNYEDLLEKHKEILTLTTPKDRDYNFLRKPQIHFFDDCLPKFYEVFIPLANKCYDYIYKDKEALTELDIPPIDLYTGRMPTENSLDVTPLYWNYKNTNITKLDPEIVPKLHSDLWTNDDKLGYTLYAKSIVEFLFHKDTKPPITIGILAPWGQGKTTLMHLLECEIAKKAAKTKKESNGSNKTTLSMLLEWSENITKPVVNKLDFPTVWFNAWKYQSSEQVWAGLAHTIITQLVDGLPNQLEKEKFWFHLQLRRLDISKIRKDIHRQVLEKVLPNLIGYGFLGLTGIILFTLSLLIGGNYSLGLSIGSSLISIFSVLLSANNWRIGIKNALKTTAEGKYENYIRQPDYAAQSGYFSQVEEDLKKVFELLVNKEKPAVIFVDDLDRCTPTKVAEVIEAINLILNSEFNNCFFVIGMDAQIIATSLDVAYEKIAEKLKYISRTSGSMGWYFMEKFIQLPFVMPNLSEQQEKDFINELFNITENEKSENEIKIITEQFDELLVKDVIDYVSFKDRSKQLMKLRALDEKEFQRISSKLIEKGAQKFSDSSHEVREQIKLHMNYFRNTPRSIKRFANLYRFYRFSQWSRDLQGLKSANEIEIGIWLMLMQRWPHLVRFIQWESNISMNKGDSAFKKAEVIENLLRSSSTFEEWVKSIEKTNLMEILSFNEPLLYDFLKNNINQSVSLKKAIEVGVW